MHQITNNTVHRLHPSHHVSYNRLTISICNKFHNSMACQQQAILTIWRNTSYVHWQTISLDRLQIHKFCRPASLMVTLPKISQCREQYKTDAKFVSWSEDVTVIMINISWLSDINQEQIAHVLTTCSQSHTDHLPTQLHLLTEQQIYMYSPSMIFTVSDTSTDTHSRASQQHVYVGCTVSHTN